MREGESHVHKRSLASLRLLGSVGEPINPEVWLWYWNNVGHGKCPVVDTWWQTETGGILITPIPGRIPSSPAAHRGRSLACGPLSSTTRANPARPA